MLRIRFSIFGMFGSNVSENKTSRLHGLSNLKKKRSSRELTDWYRRPKGSDSEDCERSLRTKRRLTKSKRLGRAGLLEGREGPEG